MKESVYIETTIVSYLAARPSRDLVIAACQEMTHRWWESRRPMFDIFVSARVVAEAGEGDSDAAQRRLAILEGVPILEQTQMAEELAAMIMNKLGLPAKVTEDALHIAVAITNGMDYLLSWNCRHIANAQFIAQIERIAHENGYACPIICTPQELLEDLS